MEAAAASKQFYFVNKSQSSTLLSRSVPSENSAVQRHVQTGRKRSRATKKAKVANEAHSTPDDTNGPQPGSSSTLTSSDESTAQKETENPALRSTNDTGSLQPGYGDVSHGQVLAIPSPSFQQILCRQDPFDATSVPIDKTVAGLLHYYVYYYHPSQWPNEMTLLRHGVYMFHQSVLRVMKSAISDELAMYCLLSATSCRLQFVDRLPSTIIAGKEHGYIHKALQLMTSVVATSDFQDPIQLRKCLSYIGFLSSAEAYRGNFNAAKTHLDAAARLIEPLGGVSSVEDGNLKGQLTMGDLFLSCVNLEPCYFDCSYDPGPANLLDLAEHELRQNCTSSTATSLLDKLDDVVPLELKKVVGELVESHAVKSQITTLSMSPTRAMQVTHWITLRNMAIRHRLLALKTTDARVDALRIAIIMWSLLAMNVTGRASTVKIMAPKLKSVLSQTSITEWSGNDDVKIWIMLVGMDCANADSEVMTWFTDELRTSIRCHFQLSPEKECASALAAELEKMQHTFFFDVSVQRARLRMLVEKLRHSST